MQTKIKIIVLFLLLFSGTWIAPQKASAQEVSVSFQVFYDELSPYGTWINNPDYGYVWIPDLAPGFTPYATNGYWVLTYEGWTWISNYSWGWAPFHYGRWYSDPIYGPIWIPDNQWGPGWVTWRRSGDYYGWAPIGPGISIDAAYRNGYNPPYNQWTFVRSGDFGRTNIYNYYIKSSNNISIINNSTMINNTRVDTKRNVKYNAGPDRNEVERHIGKSITPVAIRETSKPGENLDNNQLHIYRPQVQKHISSGRSPVPSKVESLKNVKPVGQRTVTTQQQKSNQPVKQQSPQQQRITQPANQQQPAQQKHDINPAKQQPVQQKHDINPAKQQPAQQKRDVNPAKQQPAQQKRDVNPAKQQPAQQKRETQSPKQQPQKNSPPQKEGKEKEAQQTRSPKK